MIYNIPGTSAYTSDITGKTYSSRARALAAEKASKRMKSLWEKKKIPLIPEGAPRVIHWSDLPASEKAHTTDASKWHGSDHRRHARWWYEHGYDDWSAEEMVADYGSDRDVTEILDAVLATSGRWSGYEMHYFDDIKEWKMIEKTSKYADDFDTDAEVVGTETGLKAGI